MPGLDDVLAEIQDRLAKLEDADKTSRLDNASIQATTLDVYDADGNLTSQWGVLPDGTTGVLAHGGVPPVAPSTPVLTPVIGGFRVAWNGVFADLSTAPVNFARIDVHVELVEDFEVSAYTRDASITRPGGGVVEFRSTSYDTHYVRLVAVTDSGLESEPSEMAAAVPLQAGAADIGADSVGALQLVAGAVVPSASATGTTGNLIPDSGFADPAWRDRRVTEQSGTQWSILAGSVTTSVGQSGYYAQCAPSAPSTDGTGLVSERIWMLPFPGVVSNPGERFYIGVWVARSTDGAGMWAPQVVFFDPDGREMNTSDASVSYWRTIESLPDASLGNYQLFDSTVTVPENVAALGVRVTREDDYNANATSAGLLLIERAELRSIMTRSEQGVNRVEVGPSGITAISGDGRVLAGLDEQGTVTATSLTVVGSVTIDGADLQTELLDPLPQGEVVRCSCANPPSNNVAIGLLDTGFTCIPGRRYRVHVTECIVRLASMGFRIHYTLDGSAPTGASPIWYYNAGNVTDTIGVEADWTLPASYSQPTQVRFYLEQMPWTSVAGSLDTTDLTNPKQIALTVSDMGKMVLDSPAGAQRFIKTYPATFSRSWNNAGMYDSGAGGMWQGRLGPSGDDYSMFGFNAAQIAADLSGATVEQCELYMYCASANNADGVYSRIRTIALGSAPGNGVFPPESATRFTLHWAIGEGRWNTLGAPIGVEFQNGTTRSFGLDPRDVAANTADYGRWDGAAQANKPQLRLTYRK